jgi:hypothetical protein
MTLIAIYQDAVDKFLLKIRNHFQAHGTDLIDILIETYPGNGAATDSAGNLLRAMEAANLIVRHTKPAPTLSQRAFDSLGGLGDDATRYFFFKGSKVVQPPPSHP